MDETAEQTPDTPSSTDEGEATQANEVVRGTAEHIGGRPPTYPPYPSTKPSVRDGDSLAALMPDTLVDGIISGRLTARGVSVRGDAHRWEGHCRQDAMAIARIGSPDTEMLLLAVADGVSSAKRSHVASHDLVHLTAGNLDKNAENLHKALVKQNESALNGLANKIVDQTVGELRAQWRAGAGPVYDDRDYATTLQVLLVPVQEDVRVRLLISVGDGGLHVCRDGVWTDDHTPSPARLLDPKTAALPGSYDSAEIRLVTSLPGDVLLLATDGMTGPLCQEHEFARRLAEYWGRKEAPAPSDFLWQAQLRAKSYDDDRTVVCLWETEATP
ncbi:protein phosphatase 2C domain-containing protein [Streptomyces sp. NPDC015414]|uniref:protein phosphatase 2C domain-containing protein n=1 Tax=Streptomyces sp. NPDC015414 TaxID=3364957 RepID=UPI00370123FB